MRITTISIAEPYDVQIDELGDNIIQIYQLIGDINDTKVAGLESLLVLLLLVVILIAVLIVLPLYYYYSTTIILVILLVVLLLHVL